MNKISQTEVEYQTWLRIKISVAAYAYEMENDSIMGDGEFDELCKKVDLSIKTTNSKMDLWFSRNFEPHTGQWIHLHPHKSALKRIYDLHHAL